MFFPLTKYIPIFQTFFSWTSYFPYIVKCFTCHPSNFNYTYYKVIIVTHIIKGWGPLKFVLIREEIFRFFLQLLIPLLINLTKSWSNVLLGFVRLIDGQLRPNIRLLKFFCVKLREFLGYPFHIYIFIHFLICFFFHRCQ